MFVEKFTRGYDSNVKDKLTPVKPFNIDLLLSSDGDISVQQTFRQGFSLYIRGAFKKWDAWTSNQNISGPAWRKQGVEYKNSQKSRWISEIVMYWERLILSLSADESVEHSTKHFISKVRNSRTV